MLPPLRVPPGEGIYAPEFPPKLDWLNVAFLRMNQLLGGHAVLVEFWDFARVNSLRTMPYMKGWHARYGRDGLRVIGVHSPGYSFGRERDTVARAVERLEVPYAVVLDPDFSVWREYGNRGWPARYVFDRRGLLRYYHYGEGDYADAEMAIQEVVREIDPELDMPEPLPPLRPEDAPGAMLEAQTDDVALPAQRERLELVRSWLDGPDYIEAEDAGAGATARFDAGGAWAVLSGAGVEEPGLFETDGTVVAEHPGLRLHGFQFTPRAPQAGD
jgi:hypothetical protein